jgi:glyoxylase-like metal-dependent hydrolase (beta-lactamase superfamily II)
MHRDHVGLAGWLVERSGAPLWMTALEYAGAVRESSPEAAVLDSRALAFYRAAGWDNEAVSCVRDRLANFADGVYPLPAACRRVVDGEAIRIGGNDWHAVVGRGHSPEHMSLLCPALEVLIAGDQVLPGISTNVSVQPHDADGNPLAHWFESLAKVREAAGDEVIVLPAHGQVFRGLHERIAALIAGYEGTLERLVPALERPQRACDLFPVMFRRPIRPDLVWLASGEALAHLSCLIGRGLVRRNTAPDGTEWYVAV